MQVPVEVRFQGDETLARAYEKRARICLSNMKATLKVNRRNVRQVKQTFMLDKRREVYCVCYSTYNLDKILIITPVSKKKRKEELSVGPKDYIYIWLKSGDPGYETYFATLIDSKSGLTVNTLEIDPEVTFSFPCERTTTVSDWMTENFSVCQTDFTDCFDMGHLTRRSSIDFVRHDESSWTAAYWRQVSQGQVTIPHSYQYNEYDVDFYTYYYTPDNRDPIIPDITVFDFITSQDVLYTWTEGTDPTKYFFSTPPDTADSGYGFMSLYTTLLNEVTPISSDFATHATYFYKEHMLGEDLVTDVAVAYTTQETFFGYPSNIHYTGVGTYNIVRKYYIPWYQHDNNPWLIHNDNVLGYTDGYYFYDYDNFLQYIPNSNKGSFENARICRLGIGNTCVLGFFLLKYYQLTSDNIFDFIVSPRFLIKINISYNCDIDPQQVLRYYPSKNGPINLSRITFENIFKARASRAKHEIFDASLADFIARITNYEFDMAVQPLQFWSPSEYGVQMLQRK